MSVINSGPKRKDSDHSSYSYMYSGIGPNKHAVRETYSFLVPGSIAAKLMSQGQIVAMGEDLQYFWQILGHGNSL